jgi:hypothetical protein
MGLQYARKSFPMFTQEPSKYCLASLTATLVCAGKERDELAAMIRAKGRCMHCEGEIEDLQ